MGEENQRKSDQFAERVLVATEAAERAAVLQLVVVLCDIGTAPQAVQNVHDLVLPPVLQHIRSLEVRAVEGRRNAKGRLLWPVLARRSW
jgi:dihydroxyacetone kinase DhaKLM complex PTS-EIIA-like component DhaM